jgi:polar amino acid transport system substrate-binding protein
MIKRLLLVLASASVLLLNTARAENSPDTDLVLLTENFPPYNMAKDGKNFAKGENIKALPPTSCVKCSSVPGSPTA